MRTILVSAYGCEPLKGSEPGVGWRWVLEMAKKNRLHVITRANNREVIEANLPQEMQGRITFYYYDLPQPLRRIKKGDKGLYLYYWLWQIGIIRLIRRLCRSIRFDYSMHLTFGSMWMPTFLPLFRIPFIWGPIGGGDGEPRPFIRMLPFRQRAMRHLRTLLNKTIVCNPAFMYPAARAAALILRTDNAAAVVPGMFRRKVYTMLETAMEPEIFEYEHKERGDDTIRLIATGRFIHNKNVMTAVRAMKQIPDKYDVKLTLIGSGPQKQEILDTARLSGISHRIEIVDSIPREEVLRHLEESDIFVFPSLREGGSWALMEGMAIGLPVICLNWSGMQVITDDSCAIRLPVTNPDRMPEQTARAIVRLIEDKALRLKMGAAGRRRIREVFNWESKGRFMERLFDELDAKRK